MKKQLIIRFSNRCGGFDDKQFRPALRDCCGGVLSLLRLEGEYEVNVTFTDDPGIREINSQFRNIDSATDVLSFPLGENGVYDVNPENGRSLLGDIIISAPHAFAQAEEYGHSPAREFGYLSVHGMLHLLGYDHMTEDEKSVMRTIEEGVLALCGLGRQE